MSQSADTETLQFYQQEAAVYSQRNGLKISPALPGFLGRLSPGASILELGCGSGRDTVEMLRLGYDATPTDGSPEMARQAENILHRQVLVLEFSEIEGDARFDGVWGACLSFARSGRLFRRGSKQDLQSVEFARDFVRQFQGRRRPGSRSLWPLLQLSVVRCA